MSADHGVLLASSSCDGKLSPELFSCEAARVKISNSKSETVIHSQKRGPQPETRVSQVKSSPLQVRTKTCIDATFLCNGIPGKRGNSSFSLSSSPPDSGSGTEDLLDRFIPFRVTGRVHMWAKAGYTPAHGTHLRAL